MAKKLVLDRPISINLPNRTTTTVPRDEVWKASICKVNTVNGAWNLQINALPNVIFGGGTTIGGTQENSATIAGAAYKLQDI